MSSAMERLWAHACSQVVLHHPITKVTASFRVRPNYWSGNSDGGTATVQMALTGLPDNRDLNTTMQDGFGFSMTLKKWPGLEVAKRFLVYAWTRMQFHDALEQAMDIDGNRVVDPHDCNWGNDANFRVFDDVVYGRIVAAMEDLFGSRGRDLALSGLIHGSLEVEHEMAWETQAHWEGM